MAHTLTEQELSRFRRAFTAWDITGDGSIRWRDLCRVMEEVGETPSSTLRKLCDRPGCEDEWIDFDEFLTITVGPQWEATGHDEEELLTEAMAEFDDGNGYAPLRDLMRIVQKRMEESGYNPTDGDLVEVYRQTLDGSLFETAGGGMAPDVMWKVFQEEFADLHKGPRLENVDSANAGQQSLKPKLWEMFAKLRFAHRGLAGCFRRLGVQLGWQNVDAAAVGGQAGDDGDATGETAGVMNVTVVDLGGNQLMFDAVDSTWSVHELKQHIETIVGVPVHRQFLSLAGDDGFGHGLRPGDAPLSKAGVVDGSTLVLAARDEVKVDYKKFVARLMDVEFGH